MAAKQTAAASIPLLRIPLGNLRPSRNNPRGAFPKEALEELAASIREKGVIQPIVVRRAAQSGAGARAGQNGDYEIVTGERRWRASKLAEVEDIPAVLRVLDDRQALEFSVIENLQRDDPHFMDEARGYRKLLSMDKSYTPDLLAERVGKSKQYVHSRLALNRLIDPFTKLAYEGHMSLGVALRLARLSGPVQNAALGFFKKYHRTDVADLATVERFLENEVYVDLKRAPFDTADAGLVPKAGSCHACPKRSGASPMLFPEIKQKDTCTDPICFRAKCDALIGITQAQHPKALRIVAGQLGYDQRQHMPAGVVRENNYGDGGWRPSQAGACESTRDAVVVLGDLNQLGTHRLVCAEPKCPVHGTRHSGGGRVTPSKPGVLNQERAKQIEGLWQRRTRHAVRVALHQALHKKQEKKLFAIPLEALRFAVGQAMNHSQMWSEGREWLEELWSISGQKGNALDRLVSETESQDTLLRLLIDFHLAHDVAHKFSDGKKIRAVAGHYQLDIKGITGAVEKEWAAKKQASYAKRDARLAREREKLTKGKKAKPAAMAKPTPGVCRHCGCTVTTPCLAGGVRCSWMDNKQNCCSNPACIAKANAAAANSGKRKVKRG